MKIFSTGLWFFDSIIIVFCTVLFSTQSPANAIKMQNASNKELENNLLQLTYNCQFNEAKALVHRVLKEDSLSLEWNYFYGMVIYYSMFIKNEYKEEGSQFTFIMERTIKIGEDRIERDSQDTIALFFTGGAYGYLALYSINAKAGSIFRAFSIAKKGMNHHEKLIAISPNYYDAYLSLGLYHAAASEVPWYIKPLLYIFGMSGDKEKGLEYLSMVSLKGNLAVYEARWMLAELYSRRGENEKVLNICQSLSSQFPNNYLYVSQVTRVLCDQKRYPEVIDIGKKVWEGSKTSDISNLWFVWNIYKYLAQAYSEQGNYQKAIEIYKKLINWHTMVTYSYTMLGNIYEKEKDNENAIDSYKKAIEAGGWAKYREQAEERLEVLTKDRK